MTKRITGIAVSIIAIYLALGSVALAGNPHADFTTNPDGCASCHRMHTATSGNLLKDPSGEAMCQTCHTAGMGADTDVMNGKYIAAGESDHLWGDPSMNLLGGGFTNIQNTSTTTSHHQMGSNKLPPGADPNTGPGAYVTLKCLSCHEAHPDKFHPNQYRLLRVRPNGSATDKEVLWNGPWTNSTDWIPAADPNDPNAYRAYTEKDFDLERPDTQTYTYNYKSGIDKWCVACHTRYTTRQDTTPYNAGDVFGNVMRFRHNTDSLISGVIDPVNGLNYNLTTDLPLNHPGGAGTYGTVTEPTTMSCITCHRSHGTDAVMSTAAAMDPVERGTLPTGSTLLRRAQRGVCTNCHANI
jgi:predicted CXXCH cytochrome family protein